MKSKSTTILFILSIVTMMISLGALIFFYRVISNKNAHTNATLVTLANKMAKKDNIKALKEKVAEIDATSDVIDGYFVNPKEVDSFLSYLESLGAPFNTEVKVQSFDPSPASKDILLVKVSSKGTFTNAMRVLMLLENAPYKIHIIRTSFGQQNDLSTEVDAKGVKRSTSVSLWQLDVSFSVLLSS